MEKQTTHSFLPILSPSQRRLSFCDASPRELNNWLQALPKANLGEMARQVHNSLLELNQLTTTAENRLQLLELLRKEVLFICQQLEPELLNQPIVLDKRLQQIAQLCQSLQQQLAAGYDLIATQQLQAIGEGKPSDSQKTLLSTALQRTCHTLRAILLRGCQLHRAPEVGLWLDIHRTYQTACKLGVQQISLDDPQSMRNEFSIEQTWLTAVLLGCVRTNQLHQESMQPLLQAFEYWVHLVKLESAQADSSLFVVALQHDRQPHYRGLVELSDSDNLDSLHVHGLNLKAMVRAIKQQLQPAVSELPTQLQGLDVALLQHLLRDFSALTQRREERNLAQDELTLCVGLRALHYFLAGERPLETLLGESTHRNEKKLFAQVEIPRQVDIWGGVIGGSDSAIDPMGGFSFTPAAAMPITGLDSKQYPLYQEKSLNRSSGGYCLSWQGKGETQLYIGDLIGIREGEQQDWWIARVSWILQQDDISTEVGVERIAYGAVPCALQRVCEGTFNTPFLHALLLPATDDKTSIALIAPKLPFQQGDQVRICLEGEETIALLERKIGGSANFNQFACQLLEKQNTQMEPASAAETENFDALWQTL